MFSDFISLAGPSSKDYLPVSIISFGVLRLLTSKLALYSAMITLGWYPPWWLGSF